MDRSFLGFIRLAMVRLSGGMPATRSSRTRLSCLDGGVYVPDWSADDEPSIASAFKVPFLASYWQHNQYLGCIPRPCVSEAEQSSYDIHLRSIYTPHSVWKLLRRVLASGVNDYAHIIAFGIDLARTDQTGTWGW